MLLKDFKLQMLIAFILGIGVAIIVVQVTEAYVINRTWPSPAASYAYDSSYPTGNWRTRATEAATAWNNVTPSPWTWSYSSSSNNKLFYINIDGAGGAVGALDPYTCGGVYCRFDLKIDTSDAPWYTGTGTPSSNEYDLLSILTHEFGHATGLGHSSSLCSQYGRATMCPSQPRGVTYFRSLEADDRNGLNANYP